MWGELVKDAIPLYGARPEALRNQIVHDQHASARSTEQRQGNTEALLTPKTSPSREAKDPWTSFRANARNHLEDAGAKDDRLRETMDEAGRTGNAKGIAADAVLAAIAYGDAITVQRLNRHNAQDHSALPEFVQHALGKRTDNDQIARLGRIVAGKNEAHYGGTTWTYADASNYREQVDRFANWAELILAEGER